MSWFFFINQIHEKIENKIIALKFPGINQQQSKNASRIPQKIARETVILPPSYSEKC